MKDEAGAIVYVHEVGDDWFNAVFYAPWMTKISKILALLFAGFLGICASVGIAVVNGFLCESFLVLPEGPMRVAVAIGVSVWNVVWIILGFTFTFPAIYAQ